MYTYILISSFLTVYIVLCCIVLYCIVLYCIVLYCIVLYCIVLYYIILDWIRLVLNVWSHLTTRVANRHAHCFNVLVI